MISCKFCSVLCPTIGKLLKHYYMNHAQHRTVHICFQPECMKKFKTFQVMRTHFYMKHPQKSCSRSEFSNHHQTVYIRCKICKRSVLWARQEVLKHFAQHLEQRKTVECPFQGCTKLYTRLMSFGIHINRNHTTWCTSKGSHPMIKERKEKKDKEEKLELVMRDGKVVSVIKKEPNEAVITPQESPDSLPGTSNGLAGKSKIFAEFSNGLGASHSLPGASKCSTGTSQSWSGNSSGIGTSHSSAGISNGLGTSHNSAGISSSLPGASQSLAGTSKCSTGTSQSLPGISSGLGASHSSAGTSKCSAGTSQSSVGTSSGLAGTSQNLAGTSSGPAGTSQCFTGFSNGPGGTSQNLAATSNGSESSCKPESEDEDYYSDTEHWNYVRLHDADTMEPWDDDIYDFDNKEQEIFDTTVRMAERYDHMPDMTRKAVDYVLRKMCQLSSYTQEMLSSRFERMLPTQIYNEVDYLMFKATSPRDLALEDLKDNHNRIHVHYKKFSTYVKPRRFTVYGKWAIRQDVVYIPIVKSLLAFLSHDDVISDIRNSECPSPDGVYQSYRDGEFFKNRELAASRETTLFLSLYVGELRFVTDDRKQVAGVYWTLLNLSPGHRAQKQGMHPCFLFYREALKYGKVEEVLEPLLSDLKHLQTTGLFVPKLGKSGKKGKTGKNVKVVVAYISGNNMASNYLAGIQHIDKGLDSQMCRFCDIKLANVYIGAEHGKTRLDGNYERDLSQLNCHKTELDGNQEQDMSQLNNHKTCNGIKCPSVFSDLKYFKVPECFPPDPADDLLKSIVSYEIALVLKKLIDDNIITKLRIFDVIRYFKYQGFDKFNYPYINEKFEKILDLTQNATQNWTLLRLLPIMFFGLIPADYKPLKLLLTLREIVYIAISARVDTSDLSTLTTLISQHKTLFKQVFPECKLLLAHHNIEHYVDAIKRYGPLTNVWSMRFKVKNCQFRWLFGMHYDENRSADPLIELGVKNAMYMHHLLRNPQYFDGETLSKKHEKFFVKAMNDEDLKNELELKFPGCFSVEEYVCVDSDFFRYRKGYFIQLHTKLASELPFAKIKSVLKINNEMYLWCEKSFASYNKVYNLYEVHRSRGCLLLKLRSLKYKQSMPQYHCVDECGEFNFIVPRHRLSGRGCEFLS